MISDAMRGDGMIALGRVLAKRERVIILHLESDAGILKLAEHILGSRAANIRNHPFTASKARSNFSFNRR
jgi:hypothetical protein